ncbi:MAG: toprim domain-containing protein [Ectothiorhodospiraceae bacterium]|nr:toprim domain-containing protein [Ectothiorhodospiraceae bacterium]
MNPQLHADITARLLRDLEFKEQGRYLQKGRCPECGKRELFVAAESPWMIKCGRENKCGAQFHVKELFPELFDSWSTRFGRLDSKAAKGEPESKTPVADAYLRYGRGFDLRLVSGWYTQESYFDPKIDAGTATVRFPLANGFWERLIDKPERFGKKKARIKYGTDYAGRWWQPPSITLHEQEEVWVVEGIFDAIALLHEGIAAVAAISCNNYPGEALEQLTEACHKAGKNRPRLVWALDGDRAGRRFALKHARTAREQGWTCEAAVIPENRRGKRDWNDALQRGELGAKDLELYRHHGALLLAESAGEKAMLIYQRTERREFAFEFGRRLFWWGLNLEKYEKAVEEIAGDKEAPLNKKERDRALQQAGAITEIANCHPTALYYQANTITDESWYYFRVEFPHDGQPVKNTFSGGQLASASEFKKRLLGIAPGAIWTGTSQQLDKLLRDQISGIKTVETIDFIGYAKEHGAYVFGDLAVKDGKIHRLNAEDYFELGRLSLKTLSQSVQLTVNDSRDDYRPDWAKMVWHAYGARGVVALAFWLGSLFAEQIRQQHKSYPFLEIIGEAGAGKSTLIEFLWKLLGRSDYEGFDPSKATMAARARNFAQVSNLPVVLIESDRDQDTAKQRQFDWDELKTAYNGRSVRARGHKNTGNDTYEPPFRGAIVISQNAPVNASDAILQRIVHLHFTREHQSPETKQTAELLERMPMEQVSGFALAATTRERALLEVIRSRMPIYETALADMPEIRVHRIAKNHAQMMALIDCLGPLGLDLLPANALSEAMVLLERMAVERQQAINADHPVVQEFWEAFDYIEGLKGGRSTLNHYHDDGKQIAVNLKHFEHEAAEQKLRVPPTPELKRHLKTSKARKFIESNRAVRSVINDSRTVKCWIFDKE